MIPLHRLLSFVLAVSLAAVAGVPAQDEAAAQEEPAAIPVVRPRGVYLDHPETGADFTALLVGGAVKAKPFYEMREEVRAALDGSSERVLLDLSATFTLNGPQVAELERVIAAGRGGGVKTWAYLEHTGPAAYRLAAACDTVVMADLGTLDLAAPAMQVTFLKDAFDVLGVHVDVLRCGDFKGAAEPLMRARMSDHLRQHYLDMLERINHFAVQRIAAGRGLSEAEVREAQMQRVFTAEEARDAGLVDRLVPWVGAREAFGREVGEDEVAFESALGKGDGRRDINLMAWLSRLLNPRRDEGVDEGSLVVLHLSGAIVDGTRPRPGSIVSGPTVETIRGLQEDGDVAGVVVRINSPGGSATASEAILLALRELAKHKPLAVSMGRVAASGGYYVACLDRPIVAEESTITGSIGVLAAKPSLGAMMRRIGIRAELVALDESASLTAVDRPWTADQKERIQSLIDGIYDVFVGHVARARGMTTAEVLEVAGGRVWSGRQALEHGLVDHIGGLDRALALVAEEAGVEEGYEVEHLPRPRNFLEVLFSEGMTRARGLLDDPRIRLLTDRIALDRALRLLVETFDSDRPVMAWTMLPEAFHLR